MCNVVARNAEDIDEFQVVAEPVPRDQLKDLKSMSVAVVAANGVAWFEELLRELHLFVRVQLKARNGYQAAMIMEHETRMGQLQDQIKEEQLRARHLKHKQEQVERELQQAIDAKEKLRMSLEDKKRQVENWKALYDNRRRDTDNQTRTLDPEPAASGSAPMRFRRSSSRGGVRARSEIIKESGRTTLKLKPPRTLSLSGYASDGALPGFRKSRPPPFSRSARSRGEADMIREATSPRSVGRRSRGITFDARSRPSPSVRSISSYA